MDVYLDAHDRYQLHTRTMFKIIQRVDSHRFAGSSREFSRCVSFPVPKVAALAPMQGSRGLSAIFSPFMCRARQARRRRAVAAAKAARLVHNEGSWIVQ